jgi:AraC-like DNA-binding protein
MSKVWLMDNMGPYYFLSYKFPLLYGPLVLLFTRNILKQRQSHAVKDILHFIPFLFAAVFTILSHYYFLPGWVEFLFDGISGTCLQLISLLIYHYLAMSEWGQYYAHATHDISGTLLLRMQWLRQFVLASAMVCILISLLLYFMYQYHPTLHFLRWGFSLLSIFIYWISYVAINKPVLFSAAINEDWRPNFASVVTIPKLVVHKPMEKYANTGLKAEEASRILKSLEEAIEQQKVFLEPGITIDKLAELLNTNRHFVSQVLNGRVGKSFYDYINHYRVNEAKRLLLDEKYSNQKIASIAYDAGFNSLSAFNDVFKKITGVSPSVFKKNTIQQQVPREQRG